MAHVAYRIYALSGIIRGMSYKKELYKDWLTGEYSLEQLAEKYQRGLMKVAVILENEEEKYGK